jgi:ATP-binding cassette subfamily B (MDR/TAP) protein 1
MLGSMIKAASSVAVCIGLAFAKQPLVSLVLLSVLPAIQILNLVNGHLQEPLYRQERRGFAQASTLIERTTKDVATVKVFNAQELEKNKFVELVNTARDSLYKQAIGWASLIAGVSFTMLTMFVAGFWYGAVLVSKGKVGVSAVMTAIWACLLASSNIQTVMTQMTTVSKGKTSLASLLSVIQEPLQTTKPWRLSALSMTPPKLRRPARCHGSFEVSAVYFAYPTRPDVPVLRGVDLFVAAGELTFIVGGSGSGKSTIAQLLLRMYPPTAGSILLDERDITAISDDYCREHVAAVQQGCILFDMSVHDNVALGVNTQRCTWLGRHRRPEDVTRDEVEEACKMADIHDFIMSLPDGYETKLGSSGTQLSGGQRQRLAIGRARIRNPTVLILDEATSALDATSRVVVFEAIRKWRQDRTTIVITHDLSQILPDDFIFVMKDGIVAEQGFQRDLMEHKGVYSGMAADQAVQPLRPRILNTWHDGSSVEELLVEEMNREELLPLRPTSVASFCGQTVSHSRPLSQIDFQTPKVNRITFDRPPSMVKKSPPSAYNAPSLAKLTAKTTRSALETTKHRMSRRGSRRTFKTLEHSTLSQATLNSVLTAGEEPDLKIVRSEYSPPPVKTSGMFAKLIPKVQLGSTYRLLRTWYPSVPNKRLLSVGLAAAMTSGVCKPLWSYQIAKLVALMSAGDKGGIARLAGIVLAISVGQAASEWIEYWAMRRLAAQWTALLRGQAFAKVIEQEKAWFDAEGHSPSALAQILIKDVEDMSSLVGTVIAGAVVVIVMSNVTVIWALVVGWKLTLIGAALGPVIAGVMVVTNITTGRAEVQNKGYREALAKTFYEVSYCTLIGADHSARPTSVVSGPWRSRTSSERASSARRAVRRSTRCAPPGSRPSGPLLRLG